MRHKLVRTWSLAACCLALGSVAGCDGEPDAPLDEPALIDLLTDLHLADARADALALPEAADSLRLAYRGGVFRRYDLDEADWDGLLDDLARRPERLAAAYDSVLARLADEPGDLPRPSTVGGVPTGPFTPPPFSSD